MGKRYFIEAENYSADHITYLVIPRNKAERIRTNSKGFKTFEHALEYLEGLEKEADERDKLLEEANQKIAAAGHSR